MNGSPDYFVWWYTAKSIGLGLVAALAAYYIGREHGRRAARREGRTAPRRLASLRRR